MSLSNYGQADYVRRNSLGVRADEPLRVGFKRFRPAHMLEPAVDPTRHVDTKLPEVEIERVLEDVSMHDDPVGGTRLSSTRLHRGPTKAWARSSNIPSTIAP
jgi:hypothetical protein